MSPQRFDSAADAGTPAPRLLWADLVRVIAILGVVILHASAPPVLLFGRISAEQWWVANGYRSVVVFALPCLVMLSGALLLTSSRFDAQSFFLRRFAKVAIPLAGWTAIYASWECCVLHEPKSLAVLVRELAGDRLGNPVSNHLWFLYLILSLYLLVPILRIYVRGAGLANQIYFATLWVGASWLLPAVERWTGIHPGLYLEFMAGMTGYFILGATIQRFAPSEMKPPWVAACAVAFAGGWLATALGTHLHTVQAGGRLSEAFYSHLSLTGLVMSISAFVLLRHLGSRLAAQSAANERLPRMIAHLAGLGYGIYLTHMLVVSGFEWGVFGIDIRRDMLHPLYGVPAFALGTFLLSGLLTEGLRRIPILRRLVP